MYTLNFTLEGAKNLEWNWEMMPVCLILLGSLFYAEIKDSKFTIYDKLLFIWI